jgi:hypothetical protein
MLDRQIRLRQTQSPSSHCPITPAGVENRLGLAVVVESVTVPKLDEPLARSPLHAGQYKNVCVAADEQPAERKVGYRSKFTVKHARACSAVVERFSARPSHLSHPTP